MALPVPPATPSPAATAPATPPPAAVEPPNSEAPATPDGPVIMLPAELLPADLPDAGKMVITYTTVPDSVDGEMRGFVVTSVVPEAGEAKPGDITSLDDAFEDAFPKPAPKPKKPAKETKSDDAD